MKKIIITGITGQDGIFLTKLLLEKSENYNIFGVGRNTKEKVFFERLQTVSKYSQDHSNLKLVNTDNFKEVEKLILDIAPDQIYHLSGPSSVYQSIKYPKTRFTITENFDYILKSVSKIKNNCRIFHASSSEMFAPSNLPLNENSPMKGNSPYALGKLENHKKIKRISKESNLNFYSGIMFNHESEYRSNDYLIMKIILEAIKIRNGDSNSLTLGSLDYVRDWSYAEDIAEALYLVTNYGESSDYVLGSGVGTSIRYIVSFIFNYLDLDWENYLNIDKSILRKNDPEIIVSDPKKINLELNWSNKVDIERLLVKCIESRLSEKV